MSLWQKNISISNSSLSYLTEKYQVIRHELLSNIIKYHHQILVPFEVFREAEVRKKCSSKASLFRAHKYFFASSTALREMMGCLSIYFFIHCSHIVIRK